MFEREREKAVCCALTFLDRKEFFPGAGIPEMLLGKCVILCLCLCVCTHVCYFLIYLCNLENTVEREVICGCIHIHA